nr:MAG TPA: hypothetical protein [Caudoviricetes sp.]
MYRFWLLKPLEVRSSTLRTRTKGMMNGGRSMYLNSSSCIMPPL